MLGLVRKHTQSWLIKAIFVVIILVFIFFFGYSKMQSGGRGRGVAAKVNGEAISYGRYKIAFENAREFYKQVFKDKMDEGMMAQVRNSALQQVINEVLLEQLANDLGITVTVKEIYDEISKNPNFQKEGQFDPYAYKNIFLPYFERRYGLNYEVLLKHGLLADKARNFLLNHANLTESEAKGEFNRQNRRWSFERYIIPESLSESGNGNYDVEGEAIAGQISESLNEGDKKTVNKLIKKYDLKREEIKDVSIANKHRLLPGNEDMEIFRGIFLLTKENSALKEPIKSGGSWYVFKFTGLKLPEEKDWEEKKDEFLKNLAKRKKQDYLKQWQDSMRAKAKIEEYVLTERS